MTLRFLDLFAGAGGLSEGFIQAGFEPVAHVEMDPAAVCTLKQWLREEHDQDILLPQWLGTYVNADDIEALLKRHGKFALCDM